LSLSYANPQASPARVVGLAFVVLLHIGLVYALVTGLAYRVVQVVTVPIETKIIEATPQQRSEPPPPPPAFEPAPIPFVPPPEVHIATPPPPPARSTAITTVTPERPPAPTAPAVSHEPVTVSPHLDPAASHEPDYPPVSRRLGEQGTVVLEVLVDASGHAVEAKVVQSSGFARLDDAAIAGVKANYRFVPGTIDGKPQPMRYTFKFTWKLQ
jgi:periplasmic protein TonB